MNSDISYSIDQNNTTINVDAIIAERMNFSFFNIDVRHNVFYTSNNDQKITRTEYGSMDFKMKDLHLDYQGDTPDELVSINYNKIPHFRIAETNVFHKFSTYIFFPKLYAKQSRLNLASSYSKLNEGYKEEFIDDLFIKAAELVLETPVFMRLTKSYEFAQHQNIGGKSNMFLTTLQLNQIVEKCRTMIEAYITDVDDSDSNDLDIGVFKDFFFVTAAFGGKQEIDNFFRHVDNQLNPSYFDKIDIAFDVVLKSVDGEKLLFFIRHGSTIVQEIIFQLFDHHIDPNNVEWFKSCLNNFGGFKHYSNNNMDGFKKFIGYSGLKNDFVFSKGGFDDNINIFTPDNLYRKHKPTYNRMVSNE